MLTYTLFKTQSMLWSITSINGQPHADLQTVRNPEHALVSNKEGRLARWSLTICPNPRACSCKQQGGKTSQTVTYNLFNTKGMLWSAIRREGQ